MHIHLSANLVKASGYTWLFGGNCLKLLEIKFSMVKFNFFFGYNYLYLIFILQNNVK